LKCKEDLKDEMCRCMTSVEAVDLASTVLALRRIGHAQPLYKRWNVRWAYQAVVK
jgi:hypothetical protein